jgi:AcrR family transcriptional regulator
VSGIPQHNGGDHDSDNNGGPSDGDGNVQEKGKTGLAGSSALPWRLVSSSSQADPDRQRIGETVVALVVEAGSAELELAEVLARSGVDRPAFERHFSDVQDCLDRIWEEMTDAHVSLVRAAAASEPSWRDGLRAAAYAALRFHQEDEVRARFFLVESLATGEFAQARRDVMMSAFVDLIDSARQELDDPASVPRSEAEAVMGAIYEATVSGMGGRGIDALPELVPQLMYLAVLPYQGAEAAREELRRGPEDLASYRRQSVRAALISLVAERGYPAVDLDAVLEQASVSREDFLLHYSGLQDCLDRIWEEMTAEFMAGLRDAFAGGGPWRDRLRRAAYYTLGYFREDATRTVFFMVGTLAAGDLATARRDRMIGLGVELIDGGRDELADPDAVPRAEAEAITGGIYEAIVSHVNNEPLETLDELVPQLMYLAVLPYQGAEAAQEELRRGPADIAHYRTGGL